MSAENSLRGKVTRQKIINAFQEILETKPMEKISVTEVCRLADVNRGTFYGYFQDIYDLAEQVVQQLLSVIEELYQEETELVEPKDHIPFILGFLRFIRDHQDIYRSCIKLTNEDVLQLEHYYAHWLKNPQWLSGRSDPELNSYRFCFFRGGFEAMIRLWLENGCNVEPEKMVELLLKWHHMEADISAEE